jgi:hypothetical protein
VRSTIYKHWTDRLKHQHQTAMEDNDEWLANNITWKKCTGLGEVQSLSYSGIDFHKPKDEERLIKEI